MAYITFHQVNPATNPCLSSHRTSQGCDACLYMNSDMYVFDHTASLRISVNVDSSTCSASGTLQEVHRKIETHQSSAPQHCNFRIHLVHVRYYSYYMCRDLAALRHCFNVTGTQGSSSSFAASLVPRPSKLGGGEGLVYTGCACALMSPTSRENIILSYSSVLWLRMMMNKCLELSECVSYAIQKLQMTEITPKAEQHSAMEAIYNRQDMFVRLPSGYGKSLC